MDFSRIAKVLILLLILGSEATFAQVTVGAARLNQYWPDIQSQSIGIVGNHTSQVNGKHLVDTLLDRGADIQRIFAPEHGFRGQHGAGETIENNQDTKTGLPVFSLYGETKKPTSESLSGIETMIFDIQDVGCRFYTYISTLHYVMEACAEEDIRVIVLDRPNPNGFYVDGPVLEPEHQSFVGMHPVPIVYGLTIGEYAQMINGEGWLKNDLQCELKVVKCSNYTHDTRYELPVAPSPNLPNMDAVYLYPSLCLFEGTNVSVGRGTEWPFQVIGKPNFSRGNFTFTPKSIPGKAPNPKYEGKTCKGFKLNVFAQEYIQNCHEVYLYWLTGFYKDAQDSSTFFNDYFDKLAGNESLRKQLKAGKPVDSIRAGWEADLKAYEKTRQQYLLYEDFE